MLLWKAAAKRQCAQEKINEAITFNAPQDYIAGLLDMAWELGLISQKEKEQAKTEIKSEERV